MKVRMVLAFMVTIIACSRTRPVVQHVLQRNGHTVLITNQSTREVVVTPWTGAQPVKIAAGGSARMPVTGGPPSWNLTVKDAANGRLLYSGTFGAGAPRTLSVGDNGARLTAKSLDHARPTPERTGKP
jgi:hypothetical protein